MKLIYKYILVLASLAVFASCSVDEINEVGRNGSVKFVARPTTFTSFDVATKSTKALTEAQLTTLESTIHTAYFLAYDNETGDRIAFQILNISSMSGSITSDYGTADDITACFIANVPYSYANSLTTLSSLSDTPLPLSYAPHSGTNGTGYIGVPSLKLDIDGNQVDDATATNCFPMFGVGEFSLSQSTTGTETIALKRLFAKVNLSIGVQLEESTVNQIFNWLEITSYPDIHFSLRNISLTNLPKWVKLTESRSYNEEADEYQDYIQSDWVESTDNNDFEGAVINYTDPINIYDVQYNENNTSLVRSYSLTFYVPEYVLLPEGSTGTNTVQGNKPNLLGSDQRPVLLTLGGYFSTSASNVNADYKIYLGEDAVESFSLFRNTQYNNSFNIVSTSHLVSGGDHRVEIKPLNFVDLYGQSANCYIISAPGTYEIDAYEGAYKSLVGKTKLIGTPDFVWQDKKNSITLLNKTTRDSKITFTVNEEDLTKAIVPGNAVVCIKDGNTILWSWHLWFCNENDRPDLDSKLDRYVNNSGGFNNNYVMNRALGATQHYTLLEEYSDNELVSYINQYLDGALGEIVWKDGLYYQWGRKDPLVVNGTSVNLATVTSSYNDAKKNPDKYFPDWCSTASTHTQAGWGDGTSKSVNDPCPPGYKVPAKSVWRTSNPDAKGKTYNILGQEISLLGSSTNSYTYNLTASVSEDDASGYIFYPYPSYIDSGTKKLVGKKDEPGNPINTDSKTINALFGKVKYYFSYTPKYTINQGKLWSTNGELDYIFKEAHATSEEGITAFYKTWGIWAKEPSSYQSFSFNDIPDAIKSYAESFLESLFVESEYPYSTTNDYTKTKANGYHLRCVKE